MVIPRYKEDAPSGCAAVLFFAVLQRIMHRQAQLACDHADGRIPQDKASGCAAVLQTLQVVQEYVRLHDSVPQEDFVSVLGSAYVNRQAGRVSSAQHAPMLARCWVPSLCRACMHVSGSEVDVPSCFASCHRASFILKHASAC